MVGYNFKAIAPVPTAKDFVDIVLSKTQRKTPTVVHPGYKISRIRQFYLRKVKFAQQTYHDKLTEILESFPILDDIHPFYADLMNVLYDKDHYKLALGQLNSARQMVDNVAKDYCKLLKYGDTLYRCKQLKRAALGRMVTIMRKQGSSLAYLEEVRQHLARLPNIDPNSRTLILCGYPNVGKSSFLNKVTRADVEVQPYPFTTKSLFVGHTDYEYLQWQVIDTPGILDRPLEERNTIEMQSITAMAHLRAAILYIIDVSEQCGFSLKQQLTLFAGIKPLFANKPLIIVANKADIKRIQDLPLEDQRMIQEIMTDGVTLIEMSTFTAEGVAQVKALACDKLLAQRVETKMSQATKVTGVMNRLHLAVPPAHAPSRPAMIPASVALKKQQEGMEKDEEDEENGKEEEEEESSEDEEMKKPIWLRNFNDQSHREKYDLENPEWKFDDMPQIIDGHNVADWIDADILKRLEELEKEEEALLLEEAQEKAQSMEDFIPLTEEEKALAGKIRERKKVLVRRHRDTKRLHQNNPAVPKRTERENTIEQMESHLADLGVDPSVAAGRLRERSQSRGRKRARSASVAAAEAEVAEKKSKQSSRSRSRTPFTSGEGFANVDDKLKAMGIARNAVKIRNRDAKKGEGDRVILNPKPKHLFSGKRKLGKTDRR